MMKKEKLSGVGSGGGGGVGMGLNLLLLVAMVAANILSLYHLSSTRNPPPPPPHLHQQDDVVPDHLLRQLHTIRATITHLTALRSSSASSSASSVPPELLLYSRLGPIASACSSHPDLLHRYMSYTPFSPCPRDHSSLAEPLLLRGCSPLPPPPLLLPHPLLLPLLPPRLRRPLAPHLLLQILLLPPPFPQLRSQFLPLNLHLLQVRPRPHPPPALHHRQKIRPDRPRRRRRHRRPRRQAQVRLQRLRPHHHPQPRIPLQPGRRPQGRGPPAPAAAAEVPAPGRRRGSGADGACRQPLDPRGRPGVPDVRRRQGAQARGVVVGGPLLLQGRGPGEGVRTDDGEAGLQEDQVGRREQDRRRRDQVRGGLSHCTAAQAGARSRRQGRMSKCFTVLSFRTTLLHTPVSLNCLSVLCKHNAHYGVVILVVHSFAAAYMVYITVLGGWLASV
ncbi:uncharacterized protein M6B38_321710 [Iris pallida]|uniref:Uncharacterized protein n=1 Tax=Iris pallida TaxID=29817 RepID=A0AAX6HC30_IRIPA|nr:uncharacterized protein M6B38_321710 [Iris pallida]